MQRKEVKESKRIFSKKTIMQHKRIKRLHKKLKKILCA